MNHEDHVCWGYLLAVYYKYHIILYCIVYYICVCICILVALFDTKFTWIWYNDMIWSDMDIGSTQYLWSWGFWDPRIMFGLWLCERIIFQPWPGNAGVGNEPLGTLRGHWRDICIDLEGIRHVNGGRLVVTPPGGFGWSFLSQDGDDSKTGRTDQTVFPKMECHWEKIGSNKYGSSLDRKLIHPNHKRFGVFSSQRFHCESITNATTATITFQNIM